MSARRKPLIVLIGVTFWLGYVSLTAYQYYQSAAQSAEVLIKGRKNTLEFFLSTAAPALLNENINLIESQFKNAREKFLCDFYIVQKNGKVLSYFANGASADSINREYHQFNKIIENDELAFESIKISDLVLTAGIHTNKQLVIWNVFKLDFWMIVKDITTVTLLLVTLLYAFLKDILNLSKILSQTNRGQLGKIKSSSKEVQILLRAAQGFESNQTQLKSEVQHYSNTITPAILHEIKSGKKAPYLFDSTLVRVDLNGYTQLFLQKNDEYVTEILNKYFVLARESIERYGGLIYQYVGDEIVFHFKNTHGDAAQRAIGCVRHLFEIAEKVEKELPTHSDHYFKIKACMVSGQLRFVNLDTGYGLSGLPLIESARMLSQINDKSKNTVVFYQKDFNEIASYIVDYQADKASFKGFSGKVDLCKVSHFVEIQDVLKQGEQKNLEYYLSNQDIKMLLEHIISSQAYLNDKPFFALIRPFKNLKLQNSDQNIYALFLKLFDEIYSANAQQKTSSKVLASAITLAAKLAPAHSPCSELILKLQNCLKNTDHRVCANSLIALGEYPIAKEFIREYMYSSNNRIAADAILVTGKANFDKELVNKLIEYIHSGDPRFKASALYVTNELLRYYEQIDPVFYSTNDHILKLQTSVAQLQIRQAA